MDILDGGNDEFAGDIGLGIDAGGTQTRWALIDTGGQLVASGEVAGVSALQIDSADGRAQLQASFDALARQVLRHGCPAQVYAGLTGFAGDRETLRRLIAGPLCLSARAVTLSTDIEIAYLDIFRPGEGYVVYAGTGSIGAYIDAQGRLHRAGGYGVMLDDAGGGFWIAREALRHIWRNEDETPGAWQSSPMARRIFDLIGGADWSHSRAFVYGRERGEIGKLALAVAATADRDWAARGILASAGRELARLALVLIRRFGLREVALTGRAAQLHPVIAQEFRAALPPSVTVHVGQAQGHIAAARLAVRAIRAPGLNA